MNPLNYSGDAKIRGSVYTEFTFAAILIWFVLTGVIDLAWIVQRHAALIEANADVTRALSVHFNRQRGTGASCENLASEATVAIQSWQQSSARGVGLHFQCTVSGGSPRLSSYPLVTVIGTPVTPRSCLLCLVVPFERILRSQSILTIEKANTLCNAPEFALCP